MEDDDLQEIPSSKGKIPPVRQSSGEGEILPIETSNHDEFGYPKTKSRRLEQRALKCGWNIAEEKKKAIVESLYSDAIGSERSRTRINASRVLATLDGLDISREKIEMERENPTTVLKIEMRGPQKERLIERLKRKHNS